ncbi:MAG: DNA repair protein RadA [Clostridiaceae bacterium]|nr:DNA repair protein RadA [Clostridiaceae bacterium]
MAKTKTAYVCTECGYDSPKWYGKCPSCGSWNTMAEETVREEKRGSHGVNILAPGAGNRPVRLKEISGTEDVRFSTGIGELDRVLGGGMVKGSLVLVSGAPGIGKSTLLLQACRSLCENDCVLYVTGEESLSQIKMRADRLNIDGDNLLICAETQMDQVLLSASQFKPSVMIVDSIQTMLNTELQSAPGSITQVRECTMQLLQFAKTSGTSVILVGHVNKDGGIAGPKVLEHMVDAVLNFEGDRHASYRLLRAAKNRFGSTNEIGMFEMTHCGLEEVRNPSAALLSGRPENANGSCVVATLEGTRPILAEIQGLVTKSAYGSARRTAAGIDYNRAVLLLAILEKRAGMLLGAYDTYINVVGGMDLDEPAVDLAILLSIASSYLERSIPQDLAAFGEVGLSGEVRAVTGAAQRIAELQRLGFHTCILPEDNLSGLRGVQGIRLIPVKDVQNAIRQCFESKEKQL